MYDFDTVLDRRAPDACKWNVCDGELPMWVADMDFAAAPEIRATLQARLDHGVFGYSEVPDSWREAYANWWEQRHAFRLQPDWLSDGAARFILPRASFCRLLYAFSSGRAGLFAAGCVYLCRDFFRLRRFDLRRRMRHRRAKDRTLCPR